MATKINLTMDQGSEFLNSFLVTSLDNPTSLAGYTGASQMRKHAAADENIPIDITVLSNGTVKMHLSSSITSAIEAGRYVYDVEITDGANRTYRIFEGIITVTAEITR